MKKKKLIKWIKREIGFNKSNLKWLGCPSHDRVTGQNVAYKKVLKKLEK